MKKMEQSNRELYLTFSDLAAQARFEARVALAEYERGQIEDAEQREAAFQRVAYFHKEAQAYEKKAQEYLEKHIEAFTEN